MSFFAMFKCAFTTYLFLFHNLICNLITFCYLLFTASATGFTLMLEIPNFHLKYIHNYIKKNNLR